MIEPLPHFNTTTLQEGYSHFVSQWTAEDEAEFNDGRFHASDCGQCMLKAVLQRGGLKGRPLDEDALGMFAEANLIHDCMTRFWLESGTALSCEERLTDGPFPGWSSKFDMLMHRPEWCGCTSPTSRLIEELYAPMRRHREREIVDIGSYAEVLAKHKPIMTDLKTVHPNGLKYMAKGPKQHNALQVSVYAHHWAGTYQQPVPDCAIMYRSRGGAATPIWHFFKALDAPKVMQQYDFAYDSYLEFGTLPPVEPLMAEWANDNTYGTVVKLKQSWQCGYCKYSGWHTADGNYRCEPLTTKNTTGDRIGVRTVDGKTVVLVQEWMDKGDYSYVQATDAIYNLIVDADPPIESIDLVLSSRMAKP